MRSKKLGLVVGVGLIVSLAGTPCAVGQEIPDETRRELVRGLGIPFIVFRDKVMDELKVTDQQREKLLQHLVQQVMAHTAFNEDLKGSAEEKEKKGNEYHKEMLQKLAKALKETLKPDQLKRLRQLELQRGGLYLIAERPELPEELKITDKEKMQFAPILEDLQRKTEVLVKEVRLKDNPEEILPKIIKIRKECSAKLEAALDEAQKKRWKDMVGEPFDFGD
jgi:hypothetical protein